MNEAIWVGNTIITLGGLISAGRFCYMCAYCNYHYYPSGYENSKDINATMKMFKMFAQIHSVGCSTIS